MSYRDSKRYTLCTAKSTNGVGNAILVTDLRHLVVCLATAGNANMTVKVQGATKRTDPGVEGAPNFAAAANASNAWTYVATYDLNNPSSIIVGSTGVSFSGTDGVYNLLVNVDGLDYVSIEISSASAGNLTAWLTGFDNL